MDKVDVTQLKLERAGSFPSVGSLLLKGHPISTVAAIAAMAT